MRFAWLTPREPGALAVVRVASDPRLLDRALPPPGRARFARLLAPGGTIVDEVVATALPDGLELTLHGGLGMRQTATAALLAWGLIEDTAGWPDDHWHALARAAHPAAVQRLLTEPAARHPLWFRMPTVLITGPTNAGKSTLLNAWCGHTRALVSPQAGTTRDLVAAETLVLGWRLRLYDSAGQRPANDPLEHAGQRLAADFRQRVDLVLRLDPHPHADGDALVVRAHADTGPIHDLCWSDRRAESPRLLDRLGFAVLARLGLNHG